MHTLPNTHTHSAHSNIYVCEHLEVEVNFKQLEENERITKEKPNESEKKYQRIML